MPYIEMASWSRKVREGAFHGTPIGYAVESIVFSKAMKIYFVSSSKRQFDGFLKEAKEANQLEGDEASVVWESIWKDYPDVFTVYPFDRVGSAEEYIEGMVFTSEDGKKIVRVPTKNMRKFGDMINW